MIKSELPEFEEINFTYSSQFFLIFIGLLAGLASSCLGLGAGTVINPILINYLDKYPPSVISFRNRLSLQHPFS